jgi:hypothetical protein
MHMGYGLRLQSVLLAPAIVAQPAIADGDSAQKQLPTEVIVLGNNPPDVVVLGNGPESGQGK